jgi:hypothetical protein
VLLSLLCLAQLLFGMENKSELFLDLLEECDEYVRAQEKLAELLSHGTMSLARARRDNKSVRSVEDVRGDVDATMRINTAEGGLRSGEVTYMDGDDLQLLCGMPPPSLRKSKEYFRNAIVEAVGLCILIQSIQRRVDDLTGAEDL